MQRVTQIELERLRERQTPALLVMVNFQILGLFLTCFPTSVCCGDGLREMRLARDVSEPRPKRSLFTILRRHGGGQAGREKEMETEEVGVSGRARQGDPRPDAPVPRGSVRGETSPAGVWLGRWESLPPLPRAQGEGRSELPGWSELLGILVEQLRSAEWSHWSLLLRSVREEACGAMRSGQAPSVGDLWETLLTSAMAAAAAIESPGVGEEHPSSPPPTLTGTLVGFLTGLQQVLPPGLVAAWGLFSRDVFPMLENHLAWASQQVLAAATDFMLKEALLYTRPLGFDEQEPCPQGNLRDLLVWGLRHNLTWNFRAVPLDVAQRYYPSSPSPSRPQGAAQGFQAWRILQVLQEVPERGGRFLLTRLNETLCRQDGRRRRRRARGLALLCQLLSATPPDKLVPLLERACAGARSLYASACETLSACVNGCQAAAAAASASARGHSPPGGDDEGYRLLCDYPAWDSADSVDAQALRFCGLYDGDGFGATVCANAELLERLGRDPQNFWLHDLCAGGGGAAETSPEADLARAAVDESQSTASPVGGEEASEATPAGAAPDPAPALALDVDLHCRYSEWTDLSAVHHQTVAFCEERDGREFIRVICGRPSLLGELLWDPANSRLAEVCQALGEPSLELGSLCAYGEWEQWPVVDPSVVALCWARDVERFSGAVCRDPALVASLKLERDNAWLGSVCAAGNRSEAGETRGPNATTTTTTPPTTTTTPSIDFTPGGDSEAGCEYGRWADLPSVSSAAVTFCSRHDREAFTRFVCANGSLVDRLMGAGDNGSWLLGLCSEGSAAPDSPSPTPAVPQARSPPPPSPSPPPVNGSAALCDYPNWSNLSSIHYSVLFLCLEEDAQLFASAVCGSAAALGELLKNPDNIWLATECRYQPGFEAGGDGDDYYYNNSSNSSVNNTSEAFYDPCPYGSCGEHGGGDAQLGDVLAYIHRVCRYRDWSVSLAADPLALVFCSRQDQANFTAAVCGDGGLESALRSHGENPWLPGYCSASGGGGGMLPPEATCLYADWQTARVEPTTVALCADYDRGNFYASVCRDPAVLGALSRDPENGWVQAECLYIRQSIRSAEPNPCPTQALVWRLGWTCGLGASADCPGPGFELGDVAALIVCGLESSGLTLHQPAVEVLTEALREAIDKVVLALLALGDGSPAFPQLFRGARKEVARSAIEYAQGQHAGNGTHKELLGCFGSVLLDLVQLDMGPSAEGLDLVKEYLRLSEQDLRALLLTMDIQTARQLLRLLNTNWDRLQITDGSADVLASVFLKAFLVADFSIFPELVHLLPDLTDSDILALPDSLDKEQVLTVINENFEKLCEAQRRAFARWTVSFGNSRDVTVWTPAFLQRVGNVLAYLPFENFQQLSPQQLLVQADVLVNNSLSDIQETHTIQSILNEEQHLNVSDFQRLERLVCFASSRDLVAYKRDPRVFEVIRAQLRRCLADGLFVPNGFLAEFSLSGSNISNVEALSSEQLSALAGLLPSLGLTFIQKLRPKQVLSLLPSLDTVAVSPLQARAIVGKILPNVTGETLSGLGSAVVGLSPGFLRVSPKELLEPAFPGIERHSGDLSSVQKAVIISKLWDSEEVKWLTALPPLTKEVPLISVRSKIDILLSNTTEISHTKWNVQQAQLLFRNVLEANNHNMTTDFFISLGSVAQGVTCPTLRRLITPDSLLQLLSFFQDLQVELHTSLKTCILEKLDHVNISVETVLNMGPSLLFDLQLGNIHQFSNEAMQGLVQILAQNPIPFLKIPRVKQSLLMDQVAEELNLYTRGFSKTELDLLGEASTFVPDEVFMNISRSDLKRNLWKIRDHCFNDEKQSLLGFMLMEEAMFGDPSNWTSLTLDTLDRMIFFLSVEDIIKLPQENLNLEKLETLFHSQRRWAESQLGATCLDNMEQPNLNQLSVKQQILVQKATGVLDTRQQWRQPGPPTCSSVRNTFPSAWPVSQLILMSDDEFTNCLEVIGQDPNFSWFELYSLLERVKEIHGSAAELSPAVIEQLGRVATSLAEEELARLSLSDLTAVAALGSVWEWSDSQLRVLANAVLRVSKSAMAELDSITLVALGHLICGFDPVKLALIDPMQFSAAVMWIGKLYLRCSEAQLESLAQLLPQPQAFGEVSQWGEGEFTELGSIAAGLPDIVLSSLVQEQIEGLTSVAITTIPPKKFSVVFSPGQIRMFSYEQGVAVTNDQYNKLNYLQKQALSLVLTSWDKGLIDIHGRSTGTTLYGSLVRVLMCILCGVL